MENITNLKRLLRNSRQKAQRAMLDADRYRTQLFKAQSDAEKFRKCLVPFAEAIVSAEEGYGPLRKNPDGTYGFNAEQITAIRLRPLLNDWVNATRAIYPNSFK